MCIKESIHISKDILPPQGPLWGILNKEIVLGNEHRPKSSKKKYSTTKNPRKFRPAGWNTFGQRCFCKGLIFYTPVCISLKVPNNNLPLILYKNNAFVQLNNPGWYTATSRSRSVQVYALNYINSYWFNTTAYSSRIVVVHLWIYQISSIFIWYF